MYRGVTSVHTKTADLLVMCSWINDLFDTKESLMNALGQRTIPPSMASKALIEAIVERRPYSPLMFFYLGNAGRTKRQALQRGRG